MRYFKRIKDESLKRYGIHIGKIYKENEIAWTDALTKVTVAQSHKGCPNNWKEVSEIDYIKQEGWYIRGSKEFKEWNTKKDTNVNGGFSGYFYCNLRAHPINKKRLIWSFSDRKPEGIEITLAQLQKIYNVKFNKQMKQFSIKVNPTTSKILQELAFENGWRWTGANNKSVTYTEKPYLHFWEDKTICYLDYDDADPEFPRVSLEEAIELITTEEEKIEDGDWFAVDNCGYMKSETWVSKLGEKYCYNTGRSWSYNYSFVKNKGRKATDKEIKNVLIKEAYDENTTIKSFYYGKSTATPEREHKYEKEEDLLFYHGLCVYKNGEWAEIVDEPKEIFGFKVTEEGAQHKDDHTFKLGCSDHTYTYNELERIISTLGPVATDGTITVRELRKQLRGLIDS